MKLYDMDYNFITEHTMKLNKVMAKCASVFVHSIPDLGRFFYD